MFTPRVQAEQELQGVRAQYERTYANRLTGPLDADARAFIESRDSFYMASVSETGWPYVQHRGGPVGFLKVTGPEQIGFADFRGNRQMISTGNVARDGRVSLILMDYPRRARLKMLGHMRIQSADAAPDLAATLAVDGAGRVERLALIDLVAIDWNCPQFITPRHTEDEVMARVAPALARRDAQISALADRLRALGDSSDDILTLGSKAT